METKKCPTCQNEIPSDANVCTFCGTKLTNEASPQKGKIDFGDDNTKKAILSAIIAVIGIIVMFAYRAWLGVPIYLVGFLIAVMQLRGDFEAEGGSLVEFIKDRLKNGDIGTKILTAVVAILPFVLIVGIIWYIVVDSFRDVGFF